MKSLFHEPYAVYLNELLENANHLNSHTWDSNLTAKLEDCPKDPTSWRIWLKPHVFALYHEKKSIMGPGLSNAEFVYMLVCLKTKDAFIIETK
jgi:hypothetical protein